jgi:anaerobic ribonucleoside-triphosphate reductase
VDITKIKKRDGRIVPFEKEKITKAIWKAAQAVGGKDYQTAVELTEKVVEIAQYIDDDEIATVEGIQDLVERVLVKNGHYKTAKAYILYRKQHQDIREASQLLFNNKIISDYIEKNDWRIRENSNMTFSLQGMNFHISSLIVSQYWLNKVYPPEIREGHTKGDFHIHDLGILGAYCVGWDIQDLLLEGFKGVRGKVASGPAKHFRSILGQIVNFFFTLQGEAAGAQAFSNFDTLLAPFIRYDNLDYKQVKQCLQEFVFNMNVPTRVGFQTPFTNVTMDLKVPEFMKNQPVIIGGQMMEETYGDFQAEMDLFNQAFAEVMMEGTKRTTLLPAPTSRRPFFIQTLINS